MSVTERLIAAPTEQVWDVLSDGWLFGLWVVGTSRIRDVSSEWPAVGSRIHHSVGVWPALVDDHTEVLSALPGSKLVLRARGWPLGEARVQLMLSPDGAGTRVTIEEDVTAGAGLAVPKALRSAGLGWRNVETLRRLAYVAENRAAA